MDTVHVRGLGGRSACDSCSLRGDSPHLGGRSGGTDRDATIANLIAVGVTDVDGSFARGAEPSFERGETDNVLTMGMGRLYYREERGRDESWELLSSLGERQRIPWKGCSLRGPPAHPRCLGGQALGDPVDTGDPAHRGKVLVSDPRTGWNESPPPPPHPRSKRFLGELPQLPRANAVTGGVIPVAPYYQA